MGDLRTSGSEKIHDGQDSLRLQRYRERRCAILDHVRQALVVIDTQGLITDWNAQAEVLFGWPRAEVLGRKFSQAIVTAGHRQAYEKATEKFFNQETERLRKRWLETTALRPDGHEFPVELAAFPMHNDDDLQMAAFARDLTREKQIDKEAEERHRAIMDQLGEAYLETDVRGKYIYLSEGYNQMYRPTHKAGADYKESFQPELNKFFKETYERIYQSGEPSRVEYERHLRDGRPGRFIEQSTALRRDRRGKPLGFMAISYDCTRRKQAEIDLAKAKEVAEAANRAKSEFLANMSHEIRTPLNGVLGMVELAGYTDLTTEQRELLDMARSSAGGLLAVINDILDFSKIEAGKLEFDRVEFDLRETVTQATRTVAVSSQSKGLGLSHTVAPDIPQLFRGDPVRLQQVLLNLLGNAVKFTEQGEVALRVQLRKVNGDKVELEFSVSDTGIGIPPEKQKSIFEAFCQADASTTRKFGGTGLGLTICSHIVQLMGGSIWVKSEAGKGSVFHFTIVLETVRSADATPKMSPAAISQQEENGKFRILLAEDNLVNQKLAVRLLERSGHSVMVANNGKEALAKLAEQTFDLVLMDIQMPEMDGLAATASIRRQEESTQTHLPIVALTAHAMKGDRESCLQAGMDDYVSKPVSSDQLKEAITRVMLARKQ